MLSKEHQNYLLGEVLGNADLQINFKEGISYK
jgi:hypothetical protein